MEKLKNLENKIKNINLEKRPFGRRSNKYSKKTTKKNTNKNCKGKEATHYQKK